MTQARLLLVIMALAGAGCASGRAASSPGEPAVQLPESQPRRIVELVNLYRASLGLNPLEFHPAVAAVAQSHAEGIAAGREPYSHAGLEQRVAAVGRRILNQAVGENLAVVPANRVTPMERVVERWILSDPHRAAMEGCYDLAGVGVARTPRGVVYVTILFVQRSLAQPSEARRGNDLEMARCR